MSLALQILDGPLAGRKLLVKRGQRIRVGRTEWADVAIPDSTMSAVHFELIAEEAGCRIVDLKSSNGTKLNGRRVTSATVNNRDVIGAGLTSFEVRCVVPPEDSRRCLGPNRKAVSPALRFRLAGNRFGELTNLDSF